MFAQFSNVGLVRGLGLIFFQQQHARSRTSIMLHFFAQWGGLGLIPLAILDSSLLPTFGSLDVLTAILSARQADLWPYYAGMATLGSVIGALLTYRLGLKTGLGWMERRFGQRRSMQVEHTLQHWGFGAVFVSTVAPPPFPTAVFLLSAGAFAHDLRKFLAAVFSGRVIRYGVLAAVAAHYGRTIVHYMRHPGEHIWVSLLVTSIIIAVVTATLIMLSKAPAPYQPERERPPGPSLGWRT